MAAAGYGDAGYGGVDCGGSVGYGGAGRPGPGRNCQVGVSTADGAGGDGWVGGAGCAGGDGWVGPTTGWVGAVAGGTGPVEVVGGVTRRVDGVGGQSPGIGWAGPSGTGGGGAAAGGGVAGCPCAVASSGPGCGGRPSGWVIVSPEGTSVINRTAPVPAAVPPARVVVAADHGRSSVRPTGAGGHRPAPVRVAPPRPTRAPAWYRAR